MPCCNRRLFKGFVCLAVIPWVTTSIGAGIAAAETFTSFEDWSAKVHQSQSIDFEDLAGDTVVTSQYVDLSPVGVIFAAEGSGRLRIADRQSISEEVGGQPVSGNQALDAEDPNTAGIAAMFVTGGTLEPTLVAAAGGWLLDINRFGGGVARFLDQHGMVVDQISFLPEVESNIFLGAIHEPGIAEVQFDGNFSNEFVLVDDVVFAASLPEPAGLMWMIGGIGWMAGAVGRRRRRR